MRYYIALFLVMLLFGCFEDLQPPANNTTTAPPVIDVEDNTTPGPSGNVSQPLPQDYTVDIGDTVWVNYTLWVGGEVFDTNNATLAREAGIYNPYRNYEPFTFQVAFNKGVIDGFVINVIGMRINETVHFSVDPERGYGLHDPTKVIIIPRYYNMSLYEDVPRSYLEQQGINITKGAGFDTDIGTVFIDDFNDENVTLFYILTTGHQFTVNGLPQQVVNMSNLTATIEFMLPENESYYLPHPATGATTLFKVADKNETSILLDSNHPLANKTLEFDVTLLDAEPYAG